MEGDCAAYSPDPDWFRPGLRGFSLRDSYRKTPVLVGCTWKVAQKMRALRPHLLSHFVGARTKHPNCAVRNPRRTASWTWPKPVKIRAVFGAVSLHQFFVDYLATRWLWKLTLWSFSSTIFDISNIYLSWWISDLKNRFDSDIFGTFKDGDTQIKIFFRNFKNSWRKTSECQLS